MARRGPEDPRQAKKIRMKASVTARDALGNATTKT
jgi:hypothetical protein